ncbi:MAG: hypothetical protein AAF491_07590 [Verrucomicrobiota bacterium]
MATSSEAFKTFRSTGVVVFANSTGEDYSMLPKGAKAARRNAGNTIPMVFVTTANGEEEIEGISYDILKEDMRDANRDLRDKLETVNVLGSSEAESEPVAEAVEAAEEKEDYMLAEEPLEWTNFEGRKIVAALKSLQGDTVTFVMKGKEILYPLESLSRESQDIIRELAGE